MTVSLSQQPLIACTKYILPLHPLTISLFSPSLLSPSLRHPPPPSSSSSTSAHLSFLHSLCLFPHFFFCRHACPLFFYSIFSHLFQPQFPSFISSLLHDLFFLQILNHLGSFCLAAPPPLSKPPLISLLASSSDSLDLVP